MSSVFQGYLMYLLICLMVLDVDYISLGTFGDHSERSLGIVGENPSVADRCIMMEEIVDPDIVSPYYGVYRYVVSSSQDL